MSSLDLASDVAFAAAPPRFFDSEPEPVIAGFERIATRVDSEVDAILVTDLDTSLVMQQLVDDAGGE